MSTPGCILSISDSEDVTSVLLAPAYIRFHALQAEVEMQSQCVQEEQAKNTKSSLQTESVELRHKKTDHCIRAKDATKGYWT